MKKTLIRSLVITLSVIMTFVFSVGTSFACSDWIPKCKSTLSYVAIGSSTANGYGLPGYEKGDNCFGVGTDWSSANINVNQNQLPYTVLFKNALTNKYQYKNVTFTNLCLEGMRPNELRAVLDPAYREKFLGSATNNRSDAFLTKHLFWWSGKTYEMKFEGERFSDMDQLETYFKEKIANADVITLDICDNSVGTYLTNRITGLLSENGKTKYGLYSKTNPESENSDYDFDNDILGYYDHTLNDMKDDLPCVVKAYLPAMEKIANQLF